jgi:hypothetical protein
VCDEPGLSDASGDDDGGPEGALPTPGERLLYALGQLYRLWRQGKLPVHPDVFDIEDVARVVGVSGQLEMVTTDAKGKTYHFPGEVLVVRERERFPWRLASVEEWAAAQDVDAFWADFDSG